MKKSNRLRLLFWLLFAVCFRAFPQDDSLAFYFNRNAPVPAAACIRLFRDFKPGDSVRIGRIASRILLPDQKIQFLQAAGRRFYRSDDYDNARFYYMLALTAAGGSGDKKLTAECNALVGDMYRLQDHNSIALKYLFNAAGIYKEQRDRAGLAHVLSLIGDIHRCNEQYEDAIRYGTEALSLSLKIRSSDDEAFCYSSLGSTYQAKEEYGKAYSVFKKGLELATGLLDTMRIIDFDYSIADLLIDQGNSGEAMPYLARGIKLCNITGDQYHMAFCYTGLSRAYLDQKKYRDAVEQALKAYRLGESLNASGFRVDAAAVLGDAYAALGDYKNAYRYLKMVKEDADSTTNTSSIKYQAQLEFSFRQAFREKQDSLLRAARDSQKELVHRAELDRQKTYAIMGIIGLVMALAIVFIVFRFYKKEKRTRQIINQQKQIVDLKNKEIVDSINYAKKIQQAIIPTKAEVRRLFPESFILLLPKDIVSGDFYWIAEREHFIFIAVADCTGHGVPGGFMSMLGTALLNEIINDKMMHEPADILDLLRLKIILALRQSDHANENKDGMDIALLRIDRRYSQAVFSGANNSLYVAGREKLTELKGDKRPVGFSFDQENEQFTQQSFRLEKGDVLYMFTDGFPDQFGGPLGKKFKHRQLESLLLEIHGKSMEEQHRSLLETHVQWKGSLEQVDDICIVGLRI